jgi:copper chaperone CopZ
MNPIGGVSPLFQGIELAIANRRRTMNITTVKIDGMMCSMCEAHICETIRRAFPDARKVKASRVRGEATFVTEEPADAVKLEKAITETGYRFISAETAAYKKRGLFG